MKKLNLISVTAVIIFCLVACSKQKKDLMNPISSQIQYYWFLDSSRGTSGTMGYYGSNYHSTSNPISYAFSIHSSEMVLYCPFQAYIDTVSYSIVDSTITTTQLNGYFSNRFNTSNFVLKVMNVNSTNLTLKDQDSTTYYMSK